MKRAVFKYCIIFGLTYFEFREPINYKSKKQRTHKTLK